MQKGGTTKPCSHFCPHSSLKKLEICWPTSPAGPISICCHVGVKTRVIFVDPLRAGVNVRASRKIRELQKSHPQGGKTEKRWRSKTQIKKLPWVTWGARGRTWRCCAANNSIWNKIKARSSLIWWNFRGREPLVIWQGYSEVGLVRGRTVSDEWWSVTG